MASAALQAYRRTSTYRDAQARAYKALCVRVLLSLALLVTFVGWLAVSHPL